MKRPSSLRSRSAPVRHTPIRGKKRKPSEFARVYGSKARVEFVKSLSCAACGISGYSENAHVLGNGGMSRKGDAETIAPLCGPRLKNPQFAYGEHYLGCHRLFDELRALFDSQFPRFDAEGAAAKCEAAWQSHLRQTGRARPHSEAERDA